MANRDYKPQADSVVGRVIAYFMANPDEELVNTDLSVKFGKHHSAFHSLLASAVEAGHLKRAENEDDEIAYSLGDVAAPGIAAVADAGREAAPAAFTVEDRFKRPPAAKEPKAPHVRRDPFACDPLAIEIKRGVPLPVGRTQKGTDWPKLLERMVVNSYAELPLEAYSSLSGACTRAKHNGLGEFKCRKLQNQCIGLWRVA